jgi:hypothetical protein
MLGIVGETELCPRAIRTRLRKCFRFLAHWLQGQLRTTPKQCWLSEAASLAAHSLMLTLITLLAGHIQSFARLLPQVHTQVAVSPPQPLPLPEESQLRLWHTSWHKQTPQTRLGTLMCTQEVSCPCSKPTPCSLWHRTSVAAFRSAQLHRASAQCMVQACPTLLGPHNPPGRHTPREYNLRQHLITGHSFRCCTRSLGHHT